MLNCLYKNRGNPLQMNDLVDLYSKNDNTPYNTLTKKKDTSLNGIKQKLAFIMEINEESIFLIQKNNDDKRIKEIMLNPRFFK